MNRKSFRSILLASLAMLIPNMGYASAHWVELVASVTPTGAGTVWVEGNEKGYGETSNVAKINSEENPEVDIEYDFIVHAKPSDGYALTGWLDDKGEYFRDEQGNIRKDNPITLTYSTASSNPTYEVKADFNVPYTLHYDINGAEIIAPIPDRTYSIASVFHLPERTFTKDGYVFVGWKPTSDSGNWTITEAFEDEALISGKYGDVTLQAQWEKNQPADITITVTGLNEGENAIFTVAKENTETPLYTVSLAGNSSGTSSVTIKSQKSGFRCQVRPINAWTWTYTMSPGEGMVKELGENGTTFEFEAKKISSVKEHDEKSNTNWRTTP